MKTGKQITDEVAIRMYDKDWESLITPAAKYRSMAIALEETLAKLQKTESEFAETLKTMKEIKGYKLANGQIVESKSEAIRLQKKIDFEKAIWIIVNKEIGYNDSIDLVGNFLIENADELHKIFNAR